MGVDLEAIGQGFLSLFDHIMSMTWPVEFLYQSLNLDDTVVAFLPGILFAYLGVYVVCMISCLTMRFVQGQKSAFNWKQKLLNLFLTLLPFVTLQMLTGTCGEMSAAAASLGVSAQELLNAGVRNFFVYLGELFIAVGWWRIVLFVVLLVTLLYPLSQVAKCVGSYEIAGVGVMWMFYDVGLGLACAACLLLGMYSGKLIFYLGVPALLLANHFGEKREAAPQKKKTAEIYTTP